MEEPNISFTTRELDHSVVEMTFKCSKPAAFVEIDTIACESKFSDNYFHLFPGDAKTIIAKLDTENIRETKFRVTSLIDSF